MNERLDGCGLLFLHNLVDDPVQHAGCVLTGCERHFLPRPAADIDAQDAKAKARKARRTETVPVDKRSLRWLILGDDTSQPPHAWMRNLIRRNYIRRDKPVRRNHRQQLGTV